MPSPQHFAESPESLGVDPERLEALFQRAQREVDEGLLPSCQVAVARKGKIAGMRTFGRVIHRGREAAATNETLYVIFSCTKAIVSSAVWLLLQDGKLSVEERAGDVIPEFATNDKEEVTVEQLLLHTAGFPQAPYPPREWHDRAARLARFARWRTNWAPGSRFEYHPTSGMWVLAELIERRAGTGYREFIRERIARPLELEDLHVGLPPEKHGRLADIEHRGEELTEAERRELGWPDPPETEVTEETVQNFNQAHVREAGVPGGGGTMTAGDLALFYQPLLGDGRAPDGTPIWKPEMLREARRVRSGDLTDPLFGKQVSRGLGIVIAGDEDRVYRGFGRTGSQSLFGHNGAGGQIGWGDPESGLSLGYCTSGFDRNALRVARRGVAISSRAAVCAG